jgi:hypothetical protein
MENMAGISIPKNMNNKSPLKKTEIFQKTEQSHQQKKPFYVPEKKFMKIVVIRKNMQMYQK